MKDAVLLKKIGLRIKVLRAERDMSQQELGALINYEKSHMSRLENGNANAGIVTYYKIAKALGVTLSELLDIK